MVPEEQFIEAFEKHSDALFRHCFFRVSDREKAIDLVQDTFTKVWGYMRNGGNVRDLKSFLYKTLNNLIVDEYRRKKVVSLDALLEGEHVSEGSFEELRVNQETYHFDWEDLLTKLEKLPERYRKVITMRYIDGLFPKEIANILNESENVVSVSIHRGIKMLKKQFEHEE